MRNRKVQILLSAVALLLTATLFYVTRENDPIYEGKRLSEHLEAFQNCNLTFGEGFSNPPEPRVSFPSYFNGVLLEPISKVGTNALPMLVRMLGSKDSRFELWIRSKTEKNAILRKLLALKPRKTRLRQMGAVVAFDRLGSRAAPAIPKIIPLLDDPDCAQRAAFALMCIRPERERDILSLTNVFRIQMTATNHPPPSALHSAAILTLGTFGRKAAGAVPILMASMTSTNERLRAAAAVALVRIGAPPEKVVPLILASLPRTNPLPAPFGWRSWSYEGFVFDSIPVSMKLWALGEYGHHARMALPVITNLENYPLGNIKDAAWAAAAKIRTDTNRVSR